MSQDKPVAAQEPIFWACYAKEKLVEVTNNTEYVHTFKCNFPLTHRIVPLYDHAVPCASIGVKVLREQQAKITEQTEELRIIRANLAQLEKDFDQRNEKLAKADAVILRVRKDFERMDSIGGLGYGVHESINKNLAAIEQYQKGE